MNYSGLFLMLGENKAKVRLNYLQELKDEIGDLKDEKSDLLQIRQNLLFAREFLSNAALEFEELPFNSNIYDFIAKKLKELVEDDGFIVISEYDSDVDAFILKSISGKERSLTILSEKFLGMDLYEITVPMSLLSKEQQTNLYRNRWYTVDEGIYQILGKQVSKEMCLMAEKMLDIGESYVIGFTWKGKIYGNANIFLNKDKSLKGLETFQAFINLASVALQRRKAEIALNNSLEEKELLLKEIHHRVKNNLMVISSLLAIQSHYIKDQDAREVFKDSQNRAKSMAMIHEKLYSSTDLKRIDFGDYLRNLTTGLFSTYVLDPTVINLNMDVDDVNLDINTSIPLGLIVNELISNSMKYAFPEGRNGEINISLKSIDGNIILTTSDNGVGFPENLDFKNTDSLGLKLVNSLINQIQGEIELDRNDGTEFKIIFKDIEY